jgi:hypothetical protein
VGLMRSYLGPRSISGDAFSERQSLVGRGLPKLATFGLQKVDDRTLGHYSKGVKDVGNAES